MDLDILKINILAKYLMPVYDPSLTYTMYKESKKYNVKP